MRTRGQTKGFVIDKQLQLFRVVEVELKLILHQQKAVIPITNQIAHGMSLSIVFTFIRFHLSSPGILYRLPIICPEWGRG